MSILFRDRYQGHPIGEPALIPEFFFEGFNSVKYIAAMPVKVATYPFQKTQRSRLKYNKLWGNVRDLGLILGALGATAIGGVTLVEPNSPVSNITKTVLSTLLNSSSDLVLNAVTNPIPVAVTATWWFGGKIAGNIWREHESPSLGQVFNRAISSPKATLKNAIVGFAPSVPPVEPKTPTPQPAPEERVSRIQRKVAKSSQKPASDTAAGGVPTHQVKENVVAKSKPRPRLSSRIDALDGFGVEKNTSDLTGSSTSSTSSKGSAEYLMALLSIKERSLGEVQVRRQEIYNNNKEILVAYQSLTDTHYFQSFTEKEVAFIKEKGSALTEQMRPFMIAANDVSNEIEDIKARLDEVNHMESVQEVVPTITGSGDFASKATPVFEQADSNILSLTKKRAYLEQLKEQAQQIKLDEQIQKLQEDIMFAGHSPVLPFAEAANDTVATPPQGDADKAMAAATQNPKIKKWLNGSHQDPAKYQHCGL